jgi:hypothetical protein
VGVVGRGGCCDPGWRGGRGGSGTSAGDDEASRGGDEQWDSAYDLHHHGLNDNDDGSSSFDDNDGFNDDDLGSVQREVRQEGRVDHHDDHCPQSEHDDRPAFDEHDHFRLNDDHHGLAAPTNHDDDDDHDDSAAHYHNHDHVSRTWVPVAED